MTSLNDQESSKGLAAHEIPKLFDPIGKASISLEDYKQAHAESIRDPSAYWSQQAKSYLDWYVPFDQALTGDFSAGDIAWFAGGKLNVCYNAIDRHVRNGKADQVALVWEGDEPDDIRRLTYLDMQRKISQIANALHAQGVRRGDVVTIYMPMIPELPMTMLACARMGAMHSVVFAGFSSEALAQRISAARSAFVVTADLGKRGGKSIDLKGIVDAARAKIDCEDIITSVMVWERFFDQDSETAPYDMQPKDVRMDLLVAGQRPCHVPEWMDAEDGLFLLYTSGSTGTPKGLLHTTGGYALYAAFTTKNSFALEDGDLFACVADCGWITGHTYVVYGALLNGATTFVFESTPVYPDPGRYWDMVERHKITQFYTAPTAIRLLMRYGDHHPAKYDMSSVKVLGTVGEPINPEAWRWYFEAVGKSKCTIVDTYWQTETGGHIVTNFPGVTPMKPGSCTFPSYGIDTVILDPMSGEPVTEANEKGHKEGVLAVCQPWPGMARTCLGDHHRFMTTYLKVYEGYYFTGDSAYLDQDGFHWIVGRVDDVLNVSGHRIGTAEVESALVSHAAVAQAAVVGQPHEIKGQSIAAFVMLTDGFSESESLIKELRSLVRQEIGGFAQPDLICATQSLPMTRSGKIMRRILRKIVCNEVESLGDTSTLADPSIVDELIAKVAELQAAK
jgi:acetyl-CoA synthetase